MLAWSPATFQRCWEMLLSVMCGRYGVTSGSRVSALRSVSPNLVRSDWASLISASSVTAGLFLGWGNILDFSLSDIKGTPN